MHRLSHFAWLRTLVWLLALALPLQAQARFSMLGCGPAAHHQPMEMPAAAAEHAHHQHGDAQQQKKEQPATAKAHQCSACAACCIGAALPSAPLVLAGPIGHGVHLSAPEPARLGVVTALLERPPRSFLA